MAATIKDVARKAGVAFSTVSLVLNDRANVSPETKERVRRAIEELNYRPKHSARSLASKQTGNIGFILTDDHFSRAEPFYTKIFLGTEFESRLYNYYILLTTIPPSFKAATDTPRFLREHNVDGVILAGHVPTALSKLLDELDIPHVYVDYSHQKKQSNVVMMDNLNGAKAAMKHLFQLGHEKIAFIGAEITHPSISSRFEGYKVALADASIAYSEQLIQIQKTFLSVEEGFNATEILLRKNRNFTAILAANDAMATGALQCLKKNGYKIPQDVSIVGFDNIDAGTLTMPQLTTVNIDKEELGAIAVRRLIEMINSKKQFLGTIYTPVDLIIRESTSPTASN
ncbi:MAG: LacI family transcriptional regulator [Calditrichaeota bacterium]|nr:MAG: LacI family transcriptional regulator [Calditrichota bacterium]